ncbi:MAG: hypothetical protein JKY88_15035 [Pseudomonadales bacterium]|nr:hypothetical protein [Pseudomonadales bacterium]
MRTHTYLTMLSIMASFIVTSDLQANPLDRASQLELKEVEQENTVHRKIHLTRQINARDKKSWPEVQKNTKHHSDKERSKKIDRKKRVHKYRTDNNHSGDHHSNPYNNKHYRNKYYNDRYRKSHKNHSQHGVHHENRHSRKYQHGWGGQYWGQKYNRNTQNVLDWQYAGEFQTRRREKSSDIHIEVNGYTDIVELEGLGRGTVIYKAYIETHDGRLKRLRNLEGYVERGDYLRHSLGHQKYVRTLHLTVASSGRKRAYAKINVGRYRH